VLYLVILASVALVALGVARHLRRREQRAPYQPSHSSVTQTDRKPARLPAWPVNPPVLCYARSPVNGWVCDRKRWHLGDHEQYMRMGADGQPVTRSWSPGEKRHDWSTL